MGRLQTLAKRAQYASIYQQGSTYLDNLIVMKVLPNGLNLSRSGFSVTKRLGKAVKRNRLRRLLREIVRLQLIRPGWDIILIVRPRAATANYHQLERAVSELFARARLLQTGDEANSAALN